MRPWQRVCGSVVTGLLGAGWGTGISGQTPHGKVPSRYVTSAESPSSVRPGAPELPPGTILQPGENPIDLGTALRLAGVENPELLLVRQRITEAVAARQFAAAQLLPNLNVGTNYNLHRGPLQQANGTILNVNRDALYVGLGANAVGSGSPGVPGLNYNLNIGAAWYGYLTSRQRETTAAAAADAVRNDVLLRVCLAYLDLLRGDGRRVIAAKNREEAAEIVRLTDAQARSGKGRRADADRAIVELKKRDSELTQAEADTLTASARLAQLLNLDTSTRLKAIDGWVVPAPLVPDPIPLSDLLATALLQRPELAARRSEVRAALYELSLAKALPFSPNVLMGFSSGGFGGGSNVVRDAGTGPRFGGLDGRADFDVAVFWTFRNLGVGNMALNRAADSRVKQMRFRELETLNAVRSEVAEAKALVDARFLQIDAGEKATRASGDAFTADLKRILADQGLPLELVDSMRLLGRSRYEYLDAILDYNRAQFRLWVALGQPPANCLARPVPPELVPPPTVTVGSGPRVFPMPQVLRSPLHFKP